MGAPGLKATAIEQAGAFFHRLVAAACIMFGLSYWVRLIGYYEGDLWRFDLMPVHWQVACVALAVLYPFAASGLWMVATWGPVIWFICAAGEIAMHVGFPDLFGARMDLLAVHTATLAIFLGLRLAMYLESRRRSRDH